MGRALEGLNGVKKAEVSFSEKKAIVYFEEGKATVDEMVRAVSRVGFRAVEKRSPGRLVNWETDMNGDRCFKAGLWGSIIAAICCFTPVLVIGLGLIGVAAFTPYLDYVLFPMLGFFLILAFYGWSRKGKGA